MTKKKVTFNASDCIGPGIYEIYCNATNKHYIGEATNVLDRLAKHSSNLLSNRAENRQLQQDWTHYGPDQFVFTILFCGPEWSNKKDRLTKEAEIVKSYSVDQIYNVIGDALNRPLNYRVICEINGVRYSSIAEAARLTGEREQAIRTKLNNKHEHYVIIELIPHGYEPIIANGKKYDSISAAVNAGEANNRFAAYRLLLDLNRPDWNYLNPEKHINNASLHYLNNN